MTVPTLPLYEIDRAGRAALVRELGVANALRFLGQFSIGKGDYTAERHTFLSEGTLEELFEQVQQIDKEREG